MKSPPHGVKTPEKAPFFAEVPLCRSFRFSFSRVRCTVFWVAMIISAVSLEHVGCRAQRSSVGSSELLLHTADGLSLNATLYPVSHPHPPALILLHEIGGDRSQWSGFASRAQAAGVMALALDFRGHGIRDRSAQSRPYQLFDETDWTKLLYDVAAAHAALLEAGADPNNIAIVGAALGGSVGLTYSDQSRATQAVVIVSPGLEYETYTIEPIAARLRNVPTLLLVAEGDSYSLQSAHQLKSVSEAFFELRTFPGTAHAAQLLALSDTANAQILQWLEGIFASIP